jgi:acyl-CoA synthetase (AMP-forming)/AMP-acid ligase II
MSEVTDTDARQDPASVAAGSLARQAAWRPDHPAVVEAWGGRVLRYEELDRRSRALAAALVRRGLGPGSTVAMALRNGATWFEVAWALQRLGAYWVPVNWHLTAGEASYLVQDAGAQALVVDAELAELAHAASAVLEPPALRVAAGGPLEGFFDLAALTAEDPAGSPELEGQAMLYSSGTTGRPKGIRRPLSQAPFGQRTTLDGLLQVLYRAGPDSVYLSPAPLYHAAPLGFTMAAHRLGATVVVMDRFDPRGWLEAVARYRVTHSQVVPTMLVRLLELPEEVRGSFDLSSLQVVVHAAAPCPVEVKRRAMAWLGPILHEYYAGSEGNGFCAIGPEEWLARPGSVGRPVAGAVHIVGPDGEELPPGEVGTIYFEGSPPFEYHRDPERTRAAFHPRGWSTLGDLGYLDQDGYLYLSDRRTDLVITGGVNVYPREVEEVLVEHPAVADAAVVGAPDPDLGKRVVAVVELRPDHAPGDDLAGELTRFCRERLAGYKCPREIRFVPALPRTPTGKLLRRRLVEELWPTPPTEGPPKAGSTGDDAGATG